MQKSNKVGALRITNPDGTPLMSRKTTVHWTGGEHPDSVIHYQIKTVRAALEHLDRMVDRLAFGARMTNRTVEDDAYEVGVREDLERFATALAARLQMPVEQIKAEAEARVAKQFAIVMKKFEAGMKRSAQQR